MPRAAVIDIGTNSIKMTVGRRRPDGSSAIVKEEREPTRLGAELSETGSLSPKAIERTLDALLRLRQSAEAAGAEKIAAIGTQALRQAKNAGEFLQKAQESGVGIEVIAGEREARLAYAAVQSDPMLPLEEDVPVLVCDIGGGSTELVCGLGRHIRTFESLPVGAVAFSERYLKSDPPTDAEYFAASYAVAEELSAFRECRKEPAQLAGIGGTVTTVAAIAGGPKAGEHGYVLTGDQVAQVARRLRALPLAERRHTAGLEPARADIILGGLAILQGILASFQTEQLVVSRHGIRHALLAELLAAG